ncbi:MAG: hypothetical protein ACYDBR_00200 [Gaiellaceae bacterium]
MLIEKRYRGPQRSANGGYACGRIAALLAADTVEVTLRLPPPLETPLRVERDGDTLRVLDGECLIAEARPAELALDPPPPVPFANAAALVAARPDEADHPFPGCFVCGPERAAGDGLRLRPTPLGDGRVVATWRPDEIADAHVWAALDCPGAFAGDAAQTRGLSVLGRLTAHVRELPEPGDELVVLGWPLGGAGRRFLAGTALFKGDRLLAAARATWFVVGDEARDEPVASRP